MISHSLSGDLVYYYTKEDDDRGRVVLRFQGGNFNPRFIDKLIKVFKHELSIGGIVESKWISPDEIKTRGEINDTEKTFTIKDDHCAKITLTL